MYLISFTKAIWQGWKEAKERLLNEEKSTFQNCEKLAAVCTVLDHCYPENNPVFERSYSGDNSDTVGNYGDSEFLREIEGDEPTGNLYFS